MANKFFPRMPNLVEVLNQMWNAFAAGPFNALPLIGGVLTGLLTAPAITAVRNSVQTINSAASNGWYRLGKVNAVLGADVVIRLSGTAPYTGVVNGSNGSVTTILARVDNDGVVRGSFHTECATGYGSPAGVRFGSDGVVYVLVGNYLQLSLHVDAHPQAWTPLQIGYFSPAADIPGQVDAVRAWGLRIANVPGHSLYISETDTVTSNNFSAKRLSPLTDNLYDVGLAAQAYRTIYARTGTINTSDARLKCDWADLTAAEIAAACDLARAVRSYRWIDSVSDKGDLARRHIGPTVQDAIAIMEAHDLDPFTYGFICHDAWEQEVIEHSAIAAVPAVPPTAEVPAVLDDFGDVLVPAVPAAPGFPAIEAREAYTEVIREAGDRYAFRYAELSMFIAAGQAAQQDELVRRIAALEAA